MAAPADKLPGPTPFQTPEKAEEIEEQRLLTILRGYKEEARMARESGPESRHDVWRENLDAFWMRRDYSAKMEWQATEVAPYVSNYVERFSAALRQALTQIEDWNEVVDPKDEFGALSRLATKFTRLLLSKSGTNASGQATEFGKTFGDTVRSGCLMAMCAAVTWKGGRLRIDTVDPRTFLPDPTGRGLYRVRTDPIDKNELLKMADEKDSDGKPIYKKEAIERETTHVDGEIQIDREASSGAGQEISSERVPMVIDEYLATIVDRDGSTILENQLIIVLNDRAIIRGPEPNPFWHGQDWIVYHPLLSSPLGAVDGRTYVEDFRPVAQTLETATNMILDAVRMSAMNAFELDPTLLDDPDQLNNGVYPNLTLIRSEDADPDKKVVDIIELGKHLGPEAFSMWQALDGMVKEAGAQSDLSLGQTVSKGDTTATEIGASTAGQSALTNTIASDIEDDFLAPMLLLSYYTGIQHIDPEAHPEIVGGLKPEHMQAIMAQREEFRNRPMSFRAKGISSALERAQRLRGEMGLLNVVGGNPLLFQAFTDEGYSVGKFVTALLEDFSVDKDRIKMTPEEQQEVIAKKKLAAMQAALPPELGGAGPTGGAPGGGPTAQDQGGVDPLASGDGIETGI